MAKHRSEVLHREWLQLEEADGKFTLTGSGDLEFLRKLAEVRSSVAQWSGVENADSVLGSHQDNSPFSTMFREVIAKAKGEWTFPFAEDELCHCRMVATNIVDSAIIAGAHTPAKVSRQTNASTQCGTCRPDVEKILNHRLR